MAQYWTCPNCQSNLDIGEACDCEENRKSSTAEKIDVNAIPEVDFEIGCSILSSSVKKIF